MTEKKECGACLDLAPMAKYDT